MAPIQLSHSLNSLEGGYIGDYVGILVGVTKGGHYDVKTTSHLVFS